MTMAAPDLSSIEIQFKNCRADQKISKSFVESLKRIQVHQNLNFKSSKL